jgi:hypothetical protein
MTRSGLARGGNVGEGGVGVNDNLTNKISDDPRPVNIRQLLKSASSHPGI